MNTPKTRIILANNQDLFRETLSLLLKSSTDLDVVAEARNGKEAVDHLKSLHADIVILDTFMPVMDGLTAMEIICRRFPEVKVMILSDVSDNRIVCEYLSKGASSFLDKNCGKIKLIEAIKEVKRDGCYYDKSVSKAMCESLARGRTRQLIEDRCFSEKEMEVLRRICQGLTNKEIAIAMNMSASTVDFYKAKIYAKAECHNKVDLIKYALKNDLISLAEI